MVLKSEVFLLQWLFEICYTTFLIILLNFEQRNMKISIFYSWYSKFNKMIKKIV